MDITDIMYNLGALTRAIYPTSQPAPSLVGKLLTAPATGLGMLLRTQSAKTRMAKGDPDIAQYVARLPADLSDPAGGVKIDDQGPFWVGYYHQFAAIQQAIAFGPSELDRCGKHLFGERWQSEMARALNVGDRRVREWVSGERKPPAGVWADIAAMIRQRGQEGLALLHSLSASTAA